MGNVAFTGSFKQRNVFFVIILSLITFGDLFVLADFHPARTQESPAGCAERVVDVCAAAAVLAAAVIELAAAARGGDISQAGFVGVNIIAIVLGVIGVLTLFIYPFVWFYKYCKTVETVTYGRISLLLGYGSWIALHFFSFGWIWPGIIQDGLNSNSLLDSQAPRWPSNVSKH
jgi:hypothetical protein